MVKVIKNGETQGVGTAEVDEASITDAVWDEALSGHTTGGTTGKAVGDVNTNVVALQTALGSEFDGSPDVYDVLYTGVDSSAVTSDEDGSIAERLEWLQQDSVRIICDADMVASTTVIKSAQLIGEGNDAYNTGWKVCVWINDNSHGAAPEGDGWRDITDYDSVTGTITCAAFSQNVEANDRILVARDEIVDPKTMLGRIINHDIFESNQAAVITLTTTATADHALPSITIAGIPTGATIVRVKASLKIGTLRDTSTADNAINAATSLKVDADVAYGSLIDAIIIPDNSWAVDVSTSPDRGGDFIKGNIDVKAEITGNGTYYARLENCACDGNNLLLLDVQWYLHVDWSL